MAEIELGHVVSTVDKKQDGDVEITHDEGTMASKSGLALHQQAELTPQQKREERRLVWKMDLTILPLLSCMYFLASMDRGDIGNAAAAGMTKDLKMSPQMLSNAVSMFYVGYIVFQLPGDLFLRALSPPIQIGAALVTWGLFTTLLSQAKNYATVVGLRVCVGVGEAFLQASLLYLTIWYRRDELATRSAIFFANSALAGAFNGIIAYGIQKNFQADTRGMRVWQWLFLIEGVLSVSFGFIVFFLLPPVPEKLKWGWSARQKEIAVRRSREAFNVADAKIHPKHLLELVKDPKAWCYVFIYCCLNVSLACFSTFLPVIIKSFGYSTLDTQALSIPIYACTAISIVGMGIWSDRLKLRGPFLMAAFSVAAVGWLILIVSRSKHLSYAGCYLIGIGTFPCVILTQSWMNSNIIGFTRRAGMLALINMFGQCFSIIGTEVYTDAPKYTRGNSFAFGAVIIGLITSLILRIYLGRKNAQKKADQDSDEAAAQRSLGVEEIGERHPDFFYYT